MIGNKIGNLGENIAKMFLKKHNYADFTCNYIKKWGEIDIIAHKEGIVHFIEVKSVSCENLYNNKEGLSRVTPLKDRSIRPEENLTDSKLRKLSRVIQTYLIEHKEIKEWRFDLCVVYIDVTSKKARVKMIEDLVLPE